MPLDIKRAAKQLAFCAEAIYDISSEQLDELSKHLTSKEYKSKVLDWYNKFVKDVFYSKNGYAVFGVHKEPYTEYFISDITKAIGLKLESTQKPRVAISHDIDNLSGSLQLTIKSLISEKKFRPFWQSFEFVSSIQKLLELDRQYAGHNNASTLFIAAPEKAGDLVTRLKQWLIDPTYNENHSSFTRLKTLIKNYDCSVGIHGSFYSITDDLFHLEKQRLSDVLGRKIIFGRQHWLNLPNPRSYEYLNTQQIKLDSTLGWNGDCGFRGGMARPFELLLENNTKIAVIPLLLMDGPLIVDMGLNQQEQIIFIKNMLNIVLSINGCVSINWHDRAAHKDYAWNVIYEELLNHLKESGFEFQNFDNVYDDLCKRKNSRI